MLKNCKQKVKQFPIYFTLLPLFIIQSGEQPLDNLTIFNRLVARVVNQVADRISPDSSSVVIIRSQNQGGQVNWWVENWFIRVFHERGVSNIRLNPQEISANGFIVDYQVVELGVAYYPTSVKKLVERRCNLTFNIRAMDSASSTPLLVENFSDQYVDSVYISSIEKLENNNLVFTSGKIPQQRSLKKYIEPFIITITTGGIIYLFFILRSK